MNANAHHTAAEELVNLADGASSPTERTELLLAAQVHATLALVASRHEITVETTTTPTSVPGLEKITGVTRTERRSS